MNEKTFRNLKADGTIRPGVWVVITKKTRASGLVVGGRYKISDVVGSHIFVHAGGELGELIVNYDEFELG